MHSRNGVEGVGHSNRVIRPTPKLAFDAHSGSGGAIDVGKGPGLVISVTPSQASKHPDVLDNLLFDIQSKAVLVPIITSRHDIRGTDGAVNCCLVTAHPGLV